MVSHFQRVTVTMFWLTTRYVHLIKTSHFVSANAGPGSTLDFALFVVTFQVRSTKEIINS